MTGGSPLDRARGVYERLAPRYDRTMRFMERRFFGRWRPWIAERVRGQTLVVGIGTGVDLDSLPPSAAVVGIDLSPSMLEQARARADRLARPVELQVADAQALPFPDERFDTVVFSLVLCTVPDERRAVAEAFRVLRPGGRLLALEHVRSPNPVVRLGLWVWNPIAVRTTGDHLLREPLETVRAARFIVDAVARGGLGFVEALAATKPRSAGS